MQYTFLPAPGPADLARMLLKILRDLGWWKPADPPRPPAPPLPEDGEFTSTSHVMQFFITMNNPPSVKAHAAMLATWVNSCPRLNA